MGGRQGVEKTIILLFSTLQKNIELLEIATNIIISFFFWVSATHMKCIGFTSRWVKRKVNWNARKEKWIQGLVESVHSISTADALRLFNDDIISKKALEQSENAEASSHVPGLQEQSSDCSRLENYFKELQSLLSDSPALKGHFLVDE